MQRRLYYIHERLSPSISRLCCLVSLHQLSCDVRKTKFIPQKTDYIKLFPHGLFGALTFIKMNSPCLSNVNETLRSFTVREMTTKNDKTVHLWASAKNIQNTKKLPNS